MKVLYYCDWFKEYTASLAVSVAARTHEVAIIARAGSPEFAGRESDEVAIDDELAANGIELLPLAGRYLTPKSWPAVYRIYRDKKEAGFNCLHLQQNSDPRFLWMAIRMQTTLTIHESASRIGTGRYISRRRQFANKVVDRLYRRIAKSIVVHTQACYESLTPSERRKARIIPHGVTTMSVEPVDSRTILFFGYVKPYKGLEILLAAMQEVWKSQPDARLRILASGEPPESPLSARVLQDHRVDSSWGHYTEQELTAALSEARAVCLPYLSASGSGVGARAYGSGRPIVASNINGLRELVAHAELLVEPGNAHDLARALLAVLCEDYGLQSIAVERSWPAVAAAHLLAYQSPLPATPTTALPS